MSYKKDPGNKKIFVFIIAAIFTIILLLGVVRVALSGKAATKQAKDISVEDKAIQQNEKVTEEQSESVITETKYLTFSQNNNIDIYVNYLSPVIGEKDFLTFDITIDTHSVDLSKYADLTKYVALRTDSGDTILDGFEWNPKSKDSHHISGTLRVRNDIDGKPVIDSDTKSFRLIFKNIGDKGERDHIYEGDNLN